MAKERDEHKRQAFRNEIAGLAASDLVFLDEVGFSLALSLSYGWGKRGVPLSEVVPARRGKNLSVLGAIDLEGVVASTSKEGAMRRADVCPGRHRGEVGGNRDQTSGRRRTRPALRFLLPRSGGRTARDAAPG